MRRRAVWGALLLLAVVSVVAGAQQQVRGVVRDSAGGVPVSGAVVRVLDDTGGVATQTIADQQGRFTVSVAAGGARLRVIRIGFQPRDVVVPRDAADRLVAIAMLRIPALLQSVRVQDKSICPGSVERGGALVLWEQARAGLLATVVAREAKPASVRNLLFERSLTPDSDLVVRSTSRAHSGTSTRPFSASWEPARYTTIGYMLDSGAVRIFHAPDADVLLDESFGATHCFRVARDTTGHPGQIGLAFEPPPKQDSLVDVAGTLWLDAAVPALRTLEFRFTNLEPAAMDANSGGMLMFRGMPNGVVLIERWSMRLASLAVKSSDRMLARLRADDWRGRRNRRDVFVHEIRESGGEVLVASWPDGIQWVATLGEASGRVVERGTRQPIMAALAWLEGTADTMTTDGSGGFSIAPVIPGRYRLRAADTTLADFLPARTINRTITIGRAVAREPDLQLPGVSEVATNMCRGEDMRDRTSILLGRVLNADQTPAHDLQLKVNWQADYGRVLQIDGGGSAEIFSRERKIEPDRDGHFHVCGVVRERPLRFHITRGTTVLADTAIKLLGDTLVRTMTVRLPPPRHP